MNQTSKGKGQRSNPFLSGFIMGLAAPALLLTAPTVRPPLPISAVLAGDWQRIGGDLRTALKRGQRDLSAPKKVA